MTTLLLSMYLILISYNIRHGSSTTYRCLHRFRQHKLILSPASQFSLQTLPPQTSRAKGLALSSDSSFETISSLSRPGSLVMAKTLNQPTSRLSSKREMPGTRTLSPASKTVRFKSDIEQVCSFYYEDPPATIRVPGYRPRVCNEESNTNHLLQPLRWVLITPTPTVRQQERPGQCVWLDTIYLSRNNTQLIGSVIVENLEYEKSVVCRFTRDDWNTVSEVRAAYVCPRLLEAKPGAQDEFTFEINISDFANLENTTLFLCVRYHVNGLEYWDNNHGKNYRANFQLLGRRTRCELPRSLRDKARTKQPGYVVTSVPRNATQAPWNDIYTRSGQPSSSWVLVNCVGNSGLPNLYKEYDISKALATVIGEKKQTPAIDHRKPDHVTGQARWDRTWPQTLRT